MELSESSEEYSTRDQEEFDGEEANWVEWFCSQKGNEFFVEVEEDYINDDFNLTGLSSQVPWYNEALNMILDCDDEDDVEPDAIPRIETSAVVLYGLIHARFLMTTRGQAALLEKYKLSTYGVCPNSVCDAVKQKMLPIGSDVLKQSQTRLYCPCCNEIYFPRSSKLESIDGSCFGSSASLVLFMTNPQLVNKYIPTDCPKLYGFRTALSVQTRDKIRASLEVNALAVGIGKAPEDPAPDSDSN